MTRSIREIWDGFVTRSIREMIDFLMSILSTPFESTPIKHQTSLIYILRFVHLIVVIGAKFYSQRWPRDHLSWRAIINQHGLAPFRYHYVT